MKHKHKLIKKSIFFQGDTIQVWYCADRAKGCNYLREVEPMDDEITKTHTFHTYQGDVTVKSRIMGDQVEILNDKDDKEFIFKTLKFDAEKKQLWLSVIRMMKRAIESLEVNNIL